MKQRRRRERGHLRSSQVGSAGSSFGRVRVLGIASVLLAVALLVAWLVTQVDAGLTGPDGQDVAGTESEASQQRARELYAQALASRQRTPQPEAELERAAPASDPSPKEPSSNSSDSAATQIPADVSPPPIDGTYGVVFGPTGAARGSQSIGTTSTGAAWSTIKVPIAIAVERAALEAHGSDVRAAISLSDNPAAGRLWAALGEPARAGSAVEAVLRSADDLTTDVQTSVIRPPYSSFGQTIWSLEDQQRFARRLDCLDGSDAVLTAMGNVDPSQGWGLGAIGYPARFKGGWGPGPDGKYLVRQFGLVELPSGPISVAIAAEPLDGQFVTGKSQVTDLARWVAENARGAGPTTCGLVDPPS